jgi:hypothetical protein
MITGTFKINTEADENLVFKTFKQFLTEQFQDYEFEINEKEIFIEKNIWK